MASQEYLKREFIHHLSNTLAVLGAGEDFVQKIRQVEEKPLTPEVIDEIKRFNMVNIDGVKDRLALLSTISVQIKPQDPQV